MTAVPNDRIDPHVGSAFPIRKETLIATAGSCFAQNLSRVLHAAGFNYYCAEPAPGWLPDSQHADFNYGVFSARYGNVYTTRQLLQLFRRAKGTFVPEEPAWVSRYGNVADPFRPRIQPDGFASSEEMEADRAYHLSAVRTLMERCEVFVFTLGLTEAWLSKVDGAVFPIAPGCGSGEYNPERHVFHNFRVGEVIADLEAAIAELKALNPKVRIILTVSPVPLVATMSPRHVLQATVYSKSVLRTAAEEVVLNDPSVFYFGAYEIATATLNNDRYFAADKRSVTEDCVDHVMRCFFDRFAPGQQPPSLKQALSVPLAAEARSEAVKVVCDEDAIAEAMGKR